jgi:hypothetical protein
VKIIESFDVTTPDEVEFLEYLSLDPKPDHIVLSAKSTVFHDWFRSMVGSEVTTSKKWKGKYYMLPETMLATDNTYIDGVGRGLVTTHQGHGGVTYNLSWLRHVDLGKGCEIEVPGVIGMSEFEDYFNVCADRLQKIYVKHIRRSIITLRMKERF